MYLEKLIGDRDLQAFVCEDPEDASLLMNALREEQGLRRINVVTAKQVPEGSFPKLKLNPTLKKSLATFVSDTFEAPQAVKDFLLSTKNLHKVKIKSRPSLGKDIE